MWTDRSMGRLVYSAHSAYGTITEDGQDCRGACGKCAACAVRAMQSRIAQYLLSAMYLGAALWIVVNG